MARHRKYAKGRPVAYQAPPTVGPAAARRMVQAAWDWLDAAQRAVLRGRYWDGLSVDQLASASETTAGNIRRTEATALLLCRRVIDGLFDPSTGEARTVPIA